ncbi:MAG: hypothetical protein ACN2B6_07430 [Rickettsiales bacterium]
MSTEQTREQIIEGGMLVYLTNTTEAAKIADMPNLRGDHAIAFMNNGDYQTGADAINEQSIQQVRVTYDGKDHYFKRTAINSDLKATAWVETNARGEALQGERAIISYGGYTGKMPPDTSTKEGQLIDRLMDGAANPQNYQVAAFTQTALSSFNSAGANVSSIETYGHSAGGSNAMLSNTITQKKGITSSAVLVEPLKVATAAAHMSRDLEGLAPGMGVTYDDLSTNVTSIFAEHRENGNSLDSGISDHAASSITSAALEGGFQNGNDRTRNSRHFLGQGVGKQYTLDMDNVEVKSSGMGDFNMGKTLLAMISGMLSGNGMLTDTFASLLQGMPGLSSNISLASNDTQGPGSIPIAFADKGIGRS